MTEAAYPPNYKNQRRSNIGPTLLKRKRMFIRWSGDIIFRQRLLIDTSQNNICVYTFPYSLSLIAAFIVYWTFGVFATVSAGYTWVPLVSFIASIWHFGVSSWLFLNVPKIGKIAALISGAVMCIWPGFALVGTLTDFDWFQTLLFFLPVLMTVVVFIMHFKTFRSDSRPRLVIRLILSIPPFALLVSYLVYLYGLYN